MSRKILHKALRISRGLALATGAVVICAVVLGAATTALAAAPGDPFRLGQINSINKFTKLVGAGNAPRLILDNNGSGVALRLLVEPGKPPMQVNSARKVPRLNADRLDGLHQGAFLREDGKAADADNADNADTLDGYHARDFLTVSMYGQSASTTGSDTTPGTGGPNQLALASVSCKPGDILISGGYSSVDPGTQIRGTGPDDQRTWSVLWKNDDTVDTLRIQIMCSQIRQ